MTINFDCRCAIIGKTTFGQISLAKTGKHRKRNIQRLNQTKPNSNKIFKKLSTKLQETTHPDLSENQKFSLLKLELKKPTKSQRTKTSDCSGNVRIRSLRRARERKFAVKLG